MPYFVAALATAAWFVFWVAVWRIVRGAHGPDVWLPVVLTYAINLTYGLFKALPDEQMLGWGLVITVGFGLAYGARAVGARGRARTTE